MKVVIMAGGKGTRIASVKSDVPKPMIPICGKSILEYSVLRKRQDNDFKELLGDIKRMLD